MKSIMAKSNDEVIGSDKKIKFGAIFSYLAIVFEIVVNFFVIKVLTKELGNNFALYTLALSIIGIFMTDLGLSQAVSKFVSRFRVHGETEKESIFLGLVVKIYAVIDVVLCAVCFTLFFFLGNIYQGLTPTELADFKIVYIIVAVYSCISFPLLPLNGILTGHEEFSLIKILEILQKAISAVFMLVVILVGANLFMAIAANVVSSLVIAFTKLFLTLKRCKIKPTFTKKVPGLLKEVVAFTIWVAVATLANRLSIGIMSSVLATVRDTSSVNILSIAITFETYTFTISNVISGLFLPKVTKLTEEKEYSLLNEETLKIGKFQLLVSGLIFVGFVVFGKSFLSLYLEPQYSGSYLLTILLVFTVLFQSPLVIQDVQTITNGSMKQSAILDLIVSVIRLGLCWLFAYLYGEIGLVSCFCVVTVINYLLKIFFVYKKYNQLHVGFLFKKVYLRYLIPFSISLFVGFLMIKALEPSNWVTLIFEIIVFSIIYLLIVWICFFSKSEKEGFLSKGIFTKPLLAPVVSLFKKTTSYGAPLVTTIICSILCLFCSNYPNDKISLLISIVLFATVFLIFFIYIFPIFSIKKDKKTFFNYFTCTGFLVSLVVSLGIVASMIVTKSYGSVFGFMKIIMFLWTGFFISQCFSFREFLKYFRNIFAVICIVSLLLYAVVNLFGFNFSPQIYDGKYYNYYYIFYVVSKPAYSTKNCSLFWEPGIFASACIIALALEILFTDKNKKLVIGRSIVFSLCLLSTGSLAGIILVSVLVPFLLYKIPNKAGKTLCFISSIVLSLLVFSLFCFPSFYLNTFPILKNKGKSFTTRILSINIDFQIFKSYPIFGCGDKYSTLFNEIATTNYKGLLDCSLSTTGYFAATFGIIGLLFSLVIPVAILALRNDFSYGQRIALILLIFLIINKEPHTTNMLTFILYFYILDNADFFSFYKRRDKNKQYSLYSHFRGTAV